MQRFPFSSLLSTLLGSAPTEASQRPDLASIEKHAGSLNDATESLSAVNEMRERLELLIEEQGQTNKYQIELYEYVKDLRSEAKFIWWARLIFGILAVAACVFCFIAPITICFYNFEWFSALPEYTRAALLIGMLAAGVLVLQNLVKSVYRSAAERQADEFIPPQVKAIAELIKAGKGA